MPQAQFITDILKSLKTKYQQLVDDGIQFFNQYESIHAVYAKEKRRVKEIAHQLDTISSYKEKHGCYPQIKDQADTTVYIDELNKIQARSEQHISKIEPKVFQGFEKRQAMVNSIAKLIASMMMTNRDASQFITTMMLRAPLPDDRARSATNEKAKPIFIAALSVCLLKRLIEKKLLANDFILNKVPPLVESEQHKGQLEYEPDAQAKYIDDVIVPIITAALIHHIGSYSQSAEDIFQGNRYRVLEEDDRKRLIKTISEHTDNYLQYGLGKPVYEHFDDPEKYQLALDKYQLTETILNNYSSPQDPIGNILRIPVIYSSFMLSTKAEHNFRITFKAFDILKGGIDNQVIYKPFAAEFLRMVGHYPLGTGIFFISKESNLPERAVVTGLNPPEPTSAIVKQLTRRQVKFDDHTQVCATKGYIISNQEAREKSPFGTSYYKKQFPNGFFWNPAEPWERDIDHKIFWRRDNNIKSN